MLTNSFVTASLYTEIFRSLILVYRSQYRRPPPILIEGNQLDSINEALYELGDVSFSQFNSPTELSKNALVILFTPSGKFKYDSSVCEIINGEKYISTFLSVTNSLPNLPTMLSPRKLSMVYAAAFLRSISARPVFEGGVYMGGGTIFLHKVFSALKLDKPIYSFDTFSGMPEPHERDSPSGEFHFSEGTFAEATFDKVVANLAAAGIDAKDRLFCSRIDESFTHIKLINGSDLAILDMDSYLGIFHALEIMCTVGSDDFLCIVDDCTLAGVRRAILDICDRYDVLFNEVMVNLAVVAKPRLGRYWA